MGLKKICTVQKENKNDIIYTPAPVAKIMIAMCDLKEGDTVLDPSLGGGVFYNNLPAYVNKEWCEIEKDVDFFNCDKRFDCIVGNPPYSKWNNWLSHTMKLTDKFCYIFGFLNFRPNRLHAIMKEGFGLTKMRMLTVDWYFGPSIIAVFEKGKDSIIEVDGETFNCDTCNSRCGRGRNKSDYNICQKNINDNM